MHAGALAIDQGRCAHVRSPVARALCMSPQCHKRQPRRHERNGLDSDTSSGSDTHTPAQTLSNTLTALVSRIRSACSSQIIFTFTSFVPCFRRGLDALARWRSLLPMPPDRESTRSDVTIHGSQSREARKASRDRTESVTSCSVPSVRWARRKDSRFFVSPTERGIWDRTLAAGTGASLSIARCRLQPPARRGTRHQSPSLGPGDHVLYWLQRTADGRYGDIWDPFS